MATAPVFASTPRSQPVLLSAANTDRTGVTTTNMVTVATAGTSGTRIDEIRITQVDAAPAALCVVLFVHNGTAAFYLTEQVFTSSTAPSTTAGPEKYTLTFTNLFLPSGYSLRATTTVAKNVHVVALGGDF